MFTFRFIDFSFEYLESFHNNKMLNGPGIHWQCNWEIGIFILFRNWMETVRSIQNETMRFSRNIRDFNGCYQWMIFVSINSIADLPFMHNQNTNSLIIAQKYLTNSFSDILTNTQSKYIPLLYTMDMKTNRPKNALNKPPNDGRTSNEVLAKIN